MNKIKAMAVSLAFFALVACGTLTDTRDGKKSNKMKTTHFKYLGDK